MAFYVFNSQVVKGLATLVGGIGIGAVVVTGLHSFEGAESLQNSETNVLAYVDDAQTTLDNLLQQIENDKNISNSNLEKYRSALQQANDNITRLGQEMANKDAQYEADLAELQNQLADAETRINQQAQAKVDEVVAQANVEIDKANEEVANTTQAINDATSTKASESQAVQDIQSQLNSTVVTDEEVAVNGIGDVLYGDLTLVFVGGERYPYDETQDGAGWGWDKWDEYKIYDMSNGKSYFVDVNNHSRIFETSTSNSHAYIYQMKPVTDEVLINKLSELTDGFTR